MFMLKIELKLKMRDMEFKIIVIIKDSNDSN